MTICYRDEGGGGIYTCKEGMLAWEPPLSSQVNYSK